MTSPVAPPPGPSASPSDAGAVPPRLLAALALVAAAGAALAAVLVTLATVSGSTSGGIDARLDVFERIRISTGFVDLPLLALLPLAVLLARSAEPAADPPSPATRAVLAVASAVGAALTFFVVLRLVADLGGETVAPSRFGAVVYDLGALAVAVAGSYWAAAELARTPPPARPEAPGPAPGPPPRFPAGPPQPPTSPPTR